MVDVTGQTLQDEIARVQAEVKKYRGLLEAERHHTNQLRSQLEEVKKYRGLLEESLDVIKYNSEKISRLVSNREWLQKELKMRDARLKYYENFNSPSSQNFMPTRTRKRAAHKPSSEHKKTRRRPGHKRVSHG